MKAGVCLALGCQEHIIRSEDLFEDRDAEDLPEQVTLRVAEEMSCR